MKIAGGFEGLQGTEERDAAMRHEALVFPTSFAQQRLWFLDQLEPGGSTYNIAQAFRLSGGLQQPALEQSLNEIARRHEILRTTFVEVEGEPAQIVAPPVDRPLRVMRLPGNFPGEREAETGRLIQEEAYRPFDLTQGPLFRVTLFEIDAEEHILLLTMHHIVSDGWSMGVLYGELSSLYETFSQGKAPSLPELPIQYADYAVWQRGLLQGKVLEAQFSYWKQRLAHLQLLELPTDRPRPPVQSYRGARQSFVLPKALSDGLKSLSRREGATLFMTLLAAFQTLLHRYTGQDDIVVGSPVAGRTRAEIEGLIGFFVNTLVLRADLSGDPTFKQLLGRVREGALDAYDHQDLPFEKLVEELQPERDLSRNPLFQVMFAVQHDVEGQALKLASLEVEPVKIPSEAAKFDLSLGMIEEEEGLRGLLGYNSDLFEETTIQRMVGHFQTLLEGIVANPEQRLSELPILTEAERRQILFEWNDTKRDYPKDKCIHELFEEQVERTPDAVAVVCEDRQLTYRELNARANQLAYYLRKRGVGPEVLVGLCVERSVEMIVGMLGILKAGGAYVPLDPSYPEERLRYIVEDARPSLILTQRSLEDRVARLAAQTLCLDRDEAAIADGSAVDPKATDGSASNLAYVIYTSGSTGRPKGVLVEHGSVVNLIVSFVHSYQPNESDRMLQLASISFDVSVAEIFSPLASGGAVVLHRREDQLDLDQLVSTIARHRVTILGAAPSLLGALNARAQELPTLRLILSGGEALAWQHVDRLLGAARIVNGYGPTEATVCSSSYMVEPGALRRSQTVPIGRPLINTQIYLLDAHQAPVPVGCPGELYIGGAGVARGYLNQPTLTAEKFIPDPFQPGARLYRSGDLARYLPDGNIEFLGRMDDQVKIRGCRVELGEIEAVLRQHPAIEEAAVAARAEAGNPEFKVENAESSERRLVAYLVPHGERARPIRRLLRLEREGRLEDLPRYELPDGTMVIHQNDGETEFLYREIFERRMHFKHGIVIDDGDCVLDVGANIGLFSLFVAGRWPAARIYAFEPIPPIFQRLKLNAELHGLGAKLFNCALASRSGQDEFTYFPQAGAMSGRFSEDAELARRTDEVRSLVTGYLRQKTEPDAVSGALIEELAKERVTFERFTCEIKTLSEVIREEAIERIDLLKIDVERSEADVLAGIADDDWPKIRQVVVETHEDQLSRVIRSLAERGYEVKVDREPPASEGGISFPTVYAVRAGRLRPAATVPENPGRLWNGPARLLDDVRRLVGSKLPRYMAPSAFVLLESIPRTAGGKVDRGALRAPLDDRNARAAAYIAPCSPVEKALAGIFAAVLGIERVGIHDNFFNLGGHSLLAAQAVSRMRAAFPVEIPLRRLFESPTVAGLADYVETALWITRTRERAQGDPPDGDEVDI